jgi:hypothetical protein
LAITGTPEVAQQHLTEAHESTDSQWPRLGFLSPLHPFVDWLVDKVLVHLGRNQAPVVVCDVAHPTFCVQAAFSNGRGQPQLVEWLAVTHADGSSEVTDLFEALDAAGVSADMSNPGANDETMPVAELAKLLPHVVAAARTEIAARREAHDAELVESLEPHVERLREWSQRSNVVAARLDDRRRGERERRIGVIRNDTKALIDSLRTEGEPLIRVLAVLVPRP